MCCLVLVRFRVLLSPTHPFLPYVARHFSHISPCILKTAHERVVTFLIIASPPQSLAFLLKAETVLPLEPSVVASAYMDTATRSSWFTPCYESRLVEDVWPGTMRLSHFAFRTQLPVFPRGYTSLMHCVQHVLPDGREQILVT